MNYKNRLTQLEKKRPSYVISEEHRQAIVEVAFGGLSPEEVDAEIKYILADNEKRRKK